MKYINYFVNIDIRNKIINNKSIIIEIEPALLGDKKGRKYIFIFSKIRVTIFVMEKKRTSYIFVMNVYNRRYHLLATLIVFIPEI